MTTFASAFTELVRYSTGLPEPEVVHSHNLPNGDLEDVREKLSHWTGQPVTEDQVKKLFFLHDNTQAKIAFDHRLKMDPFHPAYDHGPLMGIGHPDEIALPDQSGNDERVLAVQTHDKRDAANTDNAHHFGHVYVYKDYNEKPAIYLNYLVRGPHSRNPNGSKQVMDLLDTAKELGFSGVRCQAYTRLPKFVGSKTWPKMGFNDYIPTAMVNKLPDHLKHLKDMNELMASDEGQKLWDDHIASLQPHDDTSATLDHAHFDLTEGSRSNLLLERYRQEYNRRKGIKTTYRSDHDGRRVHPDDEEQPVHSVGRRDRRGVGQQTEEGAGGEADPVRYAEGLAEVLKYTLASHEDFHRAIHADPEEQTHHLAYADWLEEQGQDEQAKLIRRAIDKGEFYIEDAARDADPVAGFSYNGFDRDFNPARMTVVSVGSAVHPNQALTWHAPIGNRTMGPEAHAKVYKDFLDNPHQYDTHAVKYTLATHEDFHRAIHNEPQEQTHHLAYADWLQEHGHEAEADHIRKAVEDGYYGLDSGAGLAPLSKGESLFGDSYRGSTRSGESANMRSLYMGSTVPTSSHRVITYIAPEYEPVSYNDRSAPVRYSAVPAHDVHDDYKPTGIAPRVGNALSQLAQEDTDAGLMAEGILRTGDHSLLKYLADKLDDDDHPLKDAYDWRHLDRGIQIDKALHREIGRHDVQYPNLDGVIESHPLTAGYLLSNWRDGMTSPVSRRAALDSVRRDVPDANRSDLHHSILRLFDNQIIRGNLIHFDPKAEADVGGHHPPAHRGMNHSLILSELKATSDSHSNDPHTYPDTRPVNKRYAAKYGAFKTPAGGMVVKESPYAVTGNWRAGGAFTNVPQPDVKTKKFTSITQIIAALKKKRVDKKDTVKYGADMDTAKATLAHVVSDPVHMEVGSHARLVAADAHRDNGLDLIADQLASDRPIVGYSHPYGQNLYIEHPSGTHYPLGTPPEVMNAVESARQRGTRIHVSLGETSGDKAGKDWLEESGVTGTIGRSTGRIRVPLLVHNSRSLGGGSLMTDRIVRIRETAGGRVLYQHPEYDHGTITLHNVEPIQAGPRTLTAEVRRDGKAHARFTNAVTALRWIKNMGLKLNTEGGE